MMLSLGVSRCAGDISKTNAGTTDMNVWDMYKRNAFEAIASGSAGDLLFSMNLAQQQSVVLLVRWSDLLPISATRAAMTCDHVFVLRCVDAAL